jgi:hypothetical protein
MELLNLNYARTEGVWCGGRTEMTLGCYILSG